MTKKKSKKALKVILIILASIVTVFMLAILVNTLIASSKAKQLEGAYGAYYETSAGRINYTVIGDGEETIVLLPGHGSPSPHFEFLSLANSLADNGCKTIIIEPLGCGLSDDTSTPRTSENICNEIHEVLSYLGEDEYYLMGHSIAGIYMLQYANKYEDELKGVIGLDASVPAQIADENPASVALSEGVYRLLLVDTGLMRLQISDVEGVPDELLSNPPYAGTLIQCFAGLSNEEKQVYAELIASRTQNRTMQKEISMFDDNAKSQMDMSFPSGVPVLYVLAGDNVNSDPNWKPYHEALASNNPSSEVTVMDGTHYIHLCREDDIVRKVIDWIN